MAKYKNPTPSVDLPTEEQYFELQEIEYTEKKFVYFAFIDVLGFKKAFENNGLNNNSKSYKKYKDVFEFYFNLINSTDFFKPSICYTGQTSDSLYFYTENIGILINFIKIFSYFSVYAMTKDVFLRGGIAKGSLYCNKDYQFYGDSVIRAYLIESNISKNPVVTIDEATYTAIVEYENLNIFANNKGRYYIKPFTYLENKFNLGLNNPLFCENKIDETKIKSIINKNRSIFEYDAKNYEKYVFLLKEYDEYYNRKENIIGGEEE